MPAPILIADEEGKVIGLGERSRLTLDFLPGAFPDADLSHWTAYARPPREDSSLTVRGLLSEGEVCAIAGPEKIGPLRPAPHRAR